VVSDPASEVAKGSSINQAMDHGENLLMREWREGKEKPLQDPITSMGGVPEWEEGGGEAGDEHVGCMVREKFHCFGGGC